MLSDTELEALLNDLESDRVERKSSITDRDKIREAVCAFANDLPNREQPGILFIGVHDDGTCANLSITDDLLLTLADIRSDGNLSPFPQMTVQTRKFSGCDVAVIVVDPSPNPPVRFKGRVWIRVGPRRAIATADEERRLIEKRRSGNLPFDQHPVPGALVVDLDLTLFQRVYLPSAVAPEVLAENDRPILQQLSSLHFLNADGSPNVAGIIVLGVDPCYWISGAYIQFVRFDGGEITDPVRDQKEITGPLPDVLRQLDEILDANVATAIQVTGAHRETRKPDYPIVALQQLTRNALSHRNYETSNAPVRVYWFEDRIEIMSPGGPYGQVSVENIGQPGVTDYRNPQITAAMRSLGNVQRFGMGFPLARKELEKNGNPDLKIEAHPTAVLVTLRKAL